MSKEDFLNRLKEDLSALTDDELKSALKYYDEYFADAHEEKIEQELEEYNVTEDIKDAGENHARPVGMDAPAYPDNSGQAQDGGARAKNPAKHRSVLLIVLLVCFSPILIPAAIAVGTALFGLLMALLSLSVALGVTAICGFLAAGLGVFHVGYGIVQIVFANVGDGLYNISAGLISTGIGIMMAYLFGKVACMLFKCKFRFLKFLGRKIIKINT